MNQKLVFSCFCFLAIIGCCSCSGNATASTNNSESDQVEEVQEIAEIPLFVRSLSDNDVLLCYWGNFIEPVKSSTNAEVFGNIHTDWAIQDKFRRNASKYSNLYLANGTACKVKFTNEQITDSNGDTILVGCMHFRPEIPNSGAYFDVVNQEINASEDGVIVTDEFLKTHKPLPISAIGKPWEEGDPVPADIVEPLEEKYGMKAERSRLFCRIGDNCIYGLVQFKGEWKDAPKDEGLADRKHCLALDVLSDAQNIYVKEQRGFYVSDDNFCWNVDDEGEYCGREIIAAFEGDDGLTLCFTQYAPESLTVGIYSPEDDQLKEKFTADYILMIDE